MSALHSLSRLNVFQKNLKSKTKRKKEKTGVQKGIQKGSRRGQERGPEGSKWESSGQSRLGGFTFCTDPNGRVAWLPFTMFFVAHLTANILNDILLYLGIGYLMVEVTVSSFLKKKNQINYINRIFESTKDNRLLKTRERTGKSMVVFRLFEKLICSNERSTKFESLYQE